MAKLPTGPKQPANAKVEKTADKPNLYRRLSNAVQAVERDPFVRIAGAGIVLFGVYVAFATLQQIQVDLKDREQERIDKAIEKLQTRAPGDTGRGSALSLLFSKGWDISNYDQSCQAVGTWDEKAGVCANAPVIRDLRMLAPESSRISVFIASGYGGMKVISNIRFGHAEILNPLVERQFFIGVDLDGAEIVGGSLRSSNLTGTFRGTAFNSTDLVGTEISGSLEGAYFKDVGLSDANIVDPSGIRNLDGIAWSDFPPVTYRQGEQANGQVFPYPLPLSLLQQVRFCKPPSIAQPIAERPNIRTVNCDAVSPQSVFDEEVRRFQEATKAASEFAN